MRFGDIFAEALAVGLAEALVDRFAVKGRILTIGGYELKTYGEEIDANEA